MTVLSKQNNLLATCVLGTDISVQHNCNKIKQIMETVGHLFTLSQELLFDPDRFINDLMCADDFADDFEEIVFKNDGVKTELWPISEHWPISEVLMCENCTQNFEDFNTIRAHLFNNPSCFHLLIKQYWYKNHDEKQLCGICDKDMLDESMLKRHCFESEDCRKAYIDLYMTIKYDVKSVLMSNSIDTRDNFLTPNINYKHSSIYAGCTPKHISETSNKEPHSSALTEAVDNFQDENSNPFKKIKRTPSMTSEIVDKVQNIPALTLTHDRSQGVNIERPFAKIKRSSTQRDFKPGKTSTPDITVRHRDSYTVKKQPLHLNHLKNTGMSQCGDKPFESARNKGKHLARSAAGQIPVQPTLSCVCCDVNFISEEEKINHLIISTPCQLYLKNSFLDGQFLNDTPICDNYALNKNMCPFCLFTVDDGEVIYHILSVIKCRNKLEDAISKFHTPSRELPTSQYEPQQPLEYKCNLCNRKYKTIKTLKRHKTLKHSDNDYSGSYHQHKKARQHCGHSDHLFCFFCKKFLKSQTDINQHQCSPTRLLSRYWYTKAVWTDNAYQCTHCTDKFFNRENDLKKHMFSHETKTSHLFTFLPGSSNQTEPLHVNDLDITNDNGSDTSCYSDNYDITIESVSDVSSVELSDNILQNKDSRTSCISAASNKNTFSEPGEVNKPSKNFACENCGSKFCLPDVFTAHVMMNSNCLSYYENQESTCSMIVPFCFKCKMNLKSDGEFIDHKCIGLVSIMYKCALCPMMVPNLISLREHENNMHKESVEFENVETIQTSNDNETFVDEASVYQCIPCQSTFDDSSQFVEHILQVHESNNTDVT